jgi:FdhD protein
MLASTVQTRKVRALLRESCGETAVEPMSQPRAWSYRYDHQLRIQRNDEARIGAEEVPRCCGIESLEQACRAPPQLANSAMFRARDLLNAMCGLAPLQGLNQNTRSMHAAAFWDPSSGIGPVREDVGRHNALDKLAGALVRHNAPCSTGGVLLTSRVSVEMVQKTAMIGVPLLVAISAPTTLAIETAEKAGITLVAVAREDGYEVFTRPDRLIFAETGIITA